jgi:hypothetical protein
LHNDGGAVFTATLPLGAADDEGAEEAAAVRKASR